MTAQAGPPETDIEAVNRKESLLPFSQKTKMGGK